MMKNEYYSEEVHGKHETFELGNFFLEMGETLRNAKLLYKTHGKLNANKIPVKRAEPSPIVTSAFNKYF